MEHSYYGMIFSNKRNKVLIREKTQMNLKNIILSERSLTKRIHLHNSIFYEVLEWTKLTKSRKIQNSVWVGIDWQGGMREYSGG